MISMAPARAKMPGSAELAELGFDDLPENAVVVVEWPDRAAGFLPADRIDVTLTLAPKLKPEFRHVRVTGYGTCARRVDRIASVLLDVGAAGGDGVTEPTYRMVVHQATGMVMVQADTSIASALARLRATAFSEAILINDLAADVVAGRRRFSKEEQ